MKMSNDSESTISASFETASTSIPVGSAFDSSHQIAANDSILSGEVYEDEPMDTDDVATIILSDNDTIYLSSDSGMEIDSDEPEYLDLTWRLPFIPHCHLRRTVSAPDLAQNGERCRDEFLPMVDDIFDMRAIRLSRETLLEDMGYWTCPEGAADQIMSGLYDLRHFHQKLTRLT
jgi:hypothetical protein